MKIIRLRQLAAISGVSLLLSAGAVRAATFNETDDAGSTLGQAASIVSDQMSPLTSITGALAGDSDLFEIFLTGGQTFSATTSSADTAQISIDALLGIPTNLVVDPKLFLFDALGNGVYANDDRFGSTQPALLSSGFSPVEAGTYFLGIAGTGLEAVSENGQIFPSEPFDQEVGPTGAGGGSPLIGFEGDRTNSFGKYTIALTGAQTIAATVVNPPDPSARVPEPATALGLMAVGAGLLLSQRGQSTEKSAD